ncbi:MAG: sulfite exporter TauE/SafE family protein [Anaerocolumna sp.]
MNIYLYILFYFISFGASIIGAICGIGGGVLIKPILDAFGVLSVASISFLSGCTVLSMSLYSIIMLKLSGKSSVDTKVGTPLAIGAVIGGIVGKNLFQIISEQFANEDRVGAIQGICLLLITAATLVYTINKDKIKTYHVIQFHSCITIGLALGILSSFLGIGGGPINLVVLYFFFSMDTKTAAQNSLYIILFSQASSLLNTLVTGNVPEFKVNLIVLMVCGGILGGMLGGRINKKMSEATVNKLFICIMLIIMVICSYNIIILI